MSRCAGQHGIAVARGIAAEIKETPMGTFAVAYLTVWLTLVSYVVRLGVCQRRLQRNLEALRDQLDRVQEPEDPTNIAA